MTGVLAQNFPGVSFDCDEIPAPTAGLPYTYQRYNGESSFGVNKNAPADLQAVARDIIRFFFANNGIQKEFCLANVVFPTMVLPQAGRRLWK